MIAVNDIINQVRVEVKDVNEVQFSDWDILNATNKALRLIANNFSMRNSDFFEKNIYYTGRETFDGAVLPDDYIALKDVVGCRGYRLSPATDGHLTPFKYLITNNRIYANGPITMFYKGTADKAVAGGNIELPNAFLDFIVAITIMLLTGKEMDEVTQAVSDMATNLIPARKYANVKLPMPFRV